MSSLAESILIWFNSADMNNSGLLLYAIDKAPAVVRFLQKWHTSQTPDENIFVLVSSLPSDPTKVCPEFELVAKEM